MIIEMILQYSVNMSSDSLHVIARIRQWGAAHRVRRYERCLKSAGFDNIDRLSYRLSRRGRCQLCTVNCSAGTAGATIGL